MDGPLYEHMNERLNWLKYIRILILWMKSEENDKFSTKPTVWRSIWYFIYFTARTNHVTSDSV